MMNIVCQICGEKIAEAIPLFLHRPMIGAMFLSPDTKHGFDPPFDPGTEWLGMLCPYCKKRPFITEEEVLTDGGIIKLPEGPNPFDNGEEPKFSLDDRFIKTIPVPKDDNGLLLHGEFTEPSPIDSAYWEPRECPECGRVVKGLGPMAAHMRSHNKK